MNIKLTGLFTLRSPLSHIGEAISTTSYLVQEPILQADGAIEEVFCYSGNAWRGQLRDLATIYLLEHLGSPRIPLQSFHLLFAGGAIGGEQVIDIERARQYRRAIPVFSIFGGGVGNQILPGKLRVSNCYPLCEEALPVLPERYHEQAVGVSYRQLIFEKNFSRKDDSKDDRLNCFLPASVEARPLIEGETDPKAERKQKGNPEQMRMTCELLIAGARLYTFIEALDVSEVELGALVSALHSFSRSPHVGGQANRGHGLVKLQYDYIDLDTGTTGAFLSIEDGPSLLARPAAEAKDAYDEYVRQQYDAMLAQSGGEMRHLLGAI